MRRRHMSILILIREQFSKSSFFKKIKKISLFQNWLIAGLTIILKGRVGFKQVSWALHWNNSQPVRNIQPKVYISTWLCCYTMCKIQSVIKSIKVLLCPHVTVYTRALLFSKNRSSGRAEGKCLQLIQLSFSSSTEINTLILEIDKYMELWLLLVKTKKTVNTSKSVSSSVEKPS